MRFPPSVLKAVSLYRLPSSGTIEYPATATSTFTAAFLPLDRKAHALEGAAYSDPHEVYCDTTVDIKPSDLLVISATNYYVKQVFTADFGGLPHKRATISSET